MLRTGLMVHRSIFFICFLASVAIAQTAREPFAIKQLQAEEASAKKDFDAAIRLYTEAIELFPKLNEVTPEFRDSTKTAASLRYESLHRLYLGRFWAYLRNGLEKEAQADVTRSLIVLNEKIDRSLKEGRSLRKKVDLEAERRLDRPSSHNSILLAAGTVFFGVSSTCRTVRSIYRDDPRLSNSVPRRFLLDEKIVNTLAAIDAPCQEARFGRAEVAATAMIEVQNRSQNFIALSLANELVFDFPKNADAYRLRARVNRYLGDERQALTDEEKANDLGRET